MDISIRVRKSERRFIMQNTVAKILKIYAVINAICGLILGLYLRGESNDPIIFGICIYFIVACVIASFGVYAFGEVVQLLQDIKDGTNHTAHTIEVHAPAANTDDEQLPKI